VALALGCSPGAASPPASSGSAAGAPGAAGAAAGAPPAPIHVRVAYPQPSASQTPLWVAQDAGLFARYGLDVEMDYVRTGNTLTRALMAREVDIASAGGNAALEAILQGIDLVLIASAANTLTFSIYGRPELGGLRDLAGRTVGLFSRGSLTETALRASLETVGLDAERDMELVPLGGAPEVLAALDSGLVQAGVLSAPFTMVARNQGYRELVDVGELGVPFTQGAIATTRPYAAEQPEAVTAFLKAYLAGIKLARENPAEAQRSIARYTRTEDPAVLEESYRVNVKTWEPVPYVTDAAIRGVLRWLPTPGAQDADPARFKDEHFLRDLEASGFVRDLYGGRAP
jgi:ABC-type nitrate/sulfonate/bicarbonate transport system substrate-binding protein